MSKTFVIVVLSLLLIISIIFSIENYSDASRARSEMLNFTSKMNTTYQRGVTETITAFYAAGVQCRALDINGTQGSITIIATKCLR